MERKEIKKDEEQEGKEGMMMEELEGGGDVEKWKRFRKGGMK